MKKRLPTFRYEKALWREGYLIIGVDEVGLGALAGALAGALCVGAVCFKKFLVSHLKKVSQSRLPRSSPM